MAWDKYDKNRKGTKKSIFKGKKKTGEYYRKLGEKMTGKIEYTPGGPYAKRK